MIAEQPKILIVDDSRIVRITLSKQLSGRFVLREAVDGEQGWESVMLDPEISVVITDTAMPKLDGFGLLDRIRASKVSRIKHLPVIVLAGAETPEERESAKQRGATDLIGKSIGAQELSARLDIILALSEKQRELDAAEEKLQATQDLLAQVDAQKTVQAAPVAMAASAIIEPTSAPAQSIETRTGLPTPSNFMDEAGRMFSFARRHEMDMALILLRITSESASANDALPLPIGKLLKRVVRNEDIVSMTAPLEFSILTKGVNMQAALGFAKRLTQALLNAKVKVQGDRVDVPLGVQGGVATLFADEPQDLKGLFELAAARSVEAEQNGGNRVIGALRIETESGPEPERVDAARALQMIKDGKLQELAPYLPSLHTQLTPLLAQLKQAGLI